MNKSTLNVTFGIMSIIVKSSVGVRILIAELIKNYYNIEK